MKNKACRRRKRGNKGEVGRERERERRYLIGWQI